MLAGRIFGPSDWQMRLLVTGSTTATSIIGGRWKGQIETLYTVDYSSTGQVRGILLDAQSSNGGPFGTGRSYNLIIPALGINVPWTSGTSASALDTYVELSDLTLTARSDGSLRLEGSDILWYVEGALFWSRGASFTLDSVMFPAHSAIPLLGVMPCLEAFASVGAAPIVGCGGCPVGSGATSAASQGGYRFYADGAWQELPITVDTLPTLTPPVGAITGTTTWNPTVEAYQDTANCLETRSSKIYILPSLDRSVARVSREYGALIQRYGFPQVDRNQVLRSYRFDCIGEPISDTTTTTNTARYPAYTEFLEVVGDTPGTIEDPLSETVYCPYVAAGYKGASNMTSYGADTSLVQIGPNMGSTADVLPSLVTYDWESKFSNTWGAPIYSYALFFPPDGGTSPYAWEADGAEADPSLYWLPIRQQVLDWPDLDPANARPGVRAHVVGECLKQNGLAGLWNGAWGGNTYSLWGVCRFVAQRFHDYADLSIQPTDSDFWTFPDGGAGSVSGTTVTLNAGTTVAELALGDWTAGTPYRAIEAMREAAWSSPSNVSSYKVELVGRDDAVLEITSGVEWPWARGKKGAGTWLQNMGGTLFTDEGTDVYPSKSLSSSILADSAAVGCFGLLPTRTGVKIRLTVVPTNPAVAVTWTIPTFTRSTMVDHNVYAERSAAWTIIDDLEGPAFRWGDQSYWDYATNSPANPPIVRGLDLASTIYDWFNLRRTRLEGIAFESGLTAEAATLFVHNVEYTQLAHFARDPDEALTTLSWLYQGENGPAAAMVNSYREFPPLWMFPHRERDADLLPVSGQFCMTTWAASEIRSHHIIPIEPSSGDVAVLHEPAATTQILTGDASTVGWQIRWHDDLETTGAEDADWRVGRDVAGVGTYKYIQRGRPYRGGLFVPPKPGRRFLALDNCRAPWPQYNEIAEDSVSGELDSLREQWSEPSSSITNLGAILTTEELQGAAITMGETGQAPLWVVRAYGGQTYLTISYDDGQTWSPETMILDDAIYPQIVSGVPDCVFGMRPDSEDEPGVIVGISREPGETSWSSVFTLTSGGTPIRVENQPFAVVGETNGTAMVLAARAEGGSGVSRWLSYDGGRTWEAV